MIQLNIAQTIKTGITNESLCYTCYCENINQIYQQNSQRERPSTGQFPLTNTHQLTRPSRQRRRGAKKESGLEPGDIWTQADESIDCDHFCAPSVGSGSSLEARRRLAGRVSVFHRALTCAETPLTFGKGPAGCFDISAVYRSRVTGAPWLPLSH